MPIGNTYEIITGTTLSTAATTYTFSSIPQIYTDLVLVVNIVPNGANVTINNFIINSDTSSSYSYTALTGLGQGTTITFNGIDIPNGSYVSSSAALTNANNLFTGTLDFMNYSNTTTYKTIITKELPGQFGYCGAWASLYRKTDAITSITLNLTPAFAIGTTFSLYGIKAA